MSTNKRVQVGSDRKQVQEVKVPEDILFLVLGLWLALVQPLLQLLFPYLLGTANMSNLDKHWVRNSIQKYNKVCHIVVKKCSSPSKTHHRP
jgi:hypothetical protein